MTETSEGNLRSGLNLSNSDTVDMCDCDPLSCCIGNGHFQKVHFEHKKLMFPGSCPAVVLSLQDHYLYTFDFP